MAQDSAPDDFDWVAAQASCRSVSMFERLRASIIEDVRRRNGLEDDRDWTFEVNEADGGFEVSRLLPSPFGGSKTGAFVKLVRVGPRILVRGDGVDVEFTAVVALDPTGTCRFVVGEAIYSEWEIRRMALEELFFEEDEDS